MQKTDRDPLAYLDSLPEPRRSEMQRLDHIIGEALEGQPRSLWEGTFWGGSEQTIVGYGDVVMGRPGHESRWFMVGLALQKEYISIYVSAVEDGQYVAERYRSRLGKVKVGKSSISFRSLDQLDLDGLAEVLAAARRQL